MSNVRAHEVATIRDTKVILQAANMNFKTAALALLLTVTGCAGSAYDIARKHDALRDYGASDAGFLVASVGTNSRLFAYSSVTFRRKGSDDLVSIGFSRKIFLGLGKAPDFETDDGVGSVVVMKLPPGEYEVFGAGAGDYGQYGYRCSLQIPPVITFALRTGETAYLGRYMVDRGRCLSLSISDEEGSDIAIAKARAVPLPASTLVRSYVPESKVRHF